ncbi:hypothetical protein ABKJ26_11560 [Exiguobacterium mexicanum]
MSNAIYDKLDEKIEELKTILRNSSAYNLCGTVAVELGQTTGPNEDIFKKTQLSSPFRQYLYMLGLLLSTEPEESNELASKEEENMDGIKKLLNEILDLHAELFFPHDDKHLDEKWMEASRVSMPVFLNYFNTNPLVYEEQIIERINEWFSPFDHYLIQHYGLSIQDLIGVYHFIQSKFQKRLDRILSLRSKVAEESQKYYSILNNNTDRIGEISSSYTQEFIHEVQQLNQIEIKEIQHEFGIKKCELFLDYFSLERKEREFKYYTSKNPFQSAPIWRMSDERLFIPLTKQLLHAMQIQLSDFLEQSEISAQYYKNRDSQTEKKTLEISKSFFGKKAEYYTSVFENDKSYNEHDLVVIYERNILIVEVKASKVKEPFRDPTKAYTRLKRDFKSDRGIQKAFEQAWNLKKIILGQDSTILYDNKGERVTKINNNQFDNIYCLAVTAEDFGVLSINLSYFLDKPEGEEYGWACNLNDFQTALESIKYLRHPPQKFLDYLNDRSKYHENIFASDELEILGYFLEEGSLGSRLNDKDDLLIFDPNASELFDEIYFEKNGYYPNAVSKDLFYKKAAPKDNRAFKRTESKKRVKRKHSRGSRKRNRRR